MSVVYAPKPDGEPRRRVMIYFDGERCWPVVVPPAIGLREAVAVARPHDNGNPVLGLWTLWYSWIDKQKLDGMIGWFPPTWYRPTIRELADLADGTWGVP